MIAIDPSWSNGLLVAIDAMLWLAGGAVLGIIHLASLRFSVTRLSAGSSAILPIGLQVLRFAFLAAILAGVAVLFGALPLLAAALGLNVARLVVLRLEWI